MNITQQINGTHEIYKYTYSFLFLINDWVEIPQHAIVRQQSYNEATALQLQTAQGTSFGSAYLEIMSLPKQGGKTEPFQPNTAKNLPPSFQKPAQRRSGRLLTLSGKQGEVAEALPGGKRRAGQ